MSGFYGPQRLDKTRVTAEELFDHYPFSGERSTEVFPYISSSTEHILWIWGVERMLEGPRGTEVTLKVRPVQGETRLLKLTRNNREQQEDGPIPGALRGNGWNPGGWRKRSPTSP